MVTFSQEDMATWRWVHRKRTGIMQCVLIGLPCWGGKSQSGSLKSWVQGLAGVFLTVWPRTPQ